MSERVWPLVIGLSSAVVAALVLADVGGALRLVAALWFLLVCPGMAFVPLIRGVAPAAQLVLGVASSLALGAIVATAMLVAGDFSENTGLLALVAICLLGSALQARQRARTRPPVEIYVHAAASNPRAAG